jgi:hypothetical protein
MAASATRRSFFTARPRLSLTSMSSGARLYTPTDIGR